jgi:eukaryotic-like serine/threonine-protein kinase
MSSEAVPPGQAPSLEIAHVLFMDIVAYSTLPMEQQTRVSIELQSVIRESSEFQRAQQHDQLLRLPTGDGMALIFFGDPEAPARCALEVSRAMPHHPDLKLRMGVHSGPVQRIDDINASRNVSGAGINYAQRVMDCGDAGHILVSRAVAEVIGETERWSAALHDIGEVEVKHGVLVHLYNLYGAGFGNEEVPHKVRQQQEQASSLRKAKARKKQRRVSIAVISAGVVVAAIVASTFYTHRAHALTDKDTVVLADFSNKTGDPVFDDTLKQGLSVALSQSPFLNLLPDEKVSDTRKMMGQDPEQRFTAEVAREVCVRTNNKAMLAGSITSLGTQYVIGLKAIHCIDGDIIAQEQAQARAKEDVLNTLDKVAISLRTKLGESLATLGKFDVPLEQATTSSLEALKAYSEALNAQGRKGDAASLPLYKRAIELDHNFASAYEGLGLAYANLQETGLANDNLQKAFNLRDRLSVRENYGISTSYYSLVTQEVEKSNDIYEQWAHAYTRAVMPHNNLAVNYMRFGQYEKALAETQEAIRLQPDFSAIWVNLMSLYVSLNRPTEAKAAYEQALARKLDDPSLHSTRYIVAFLDGDTGEMQRQVSWNSVRGTQEDLDFLSIQSDTQAYSGHMKKSRELARRAAEIAVSRDQKEGAVIYPLREVLAEAELGNKTWARRQAAQPSRSGLTRSVQIVAALALASAGDTDGALSLANELHKASPSSTLLNKYYLPTIRAAVELARKRPDTAVEMLQAASTYELGSPEPVNNLYPIYVRGESYLQAGQGQQAAAEFQKIVDHRSIVLSFVFGALAHLQLGRAKAMTGDKGAARKAYGDFLTLWKDADSDIPILKQAKAEYTTLQ